MLNHHFFIFVYVVHQQQFHPSVLNYNSNQVPLIQKLRIHFDFRYKYLISKKIKVQFCRLYFTSLQVTTFKLQINILLLSKTQVNTIVAQVTKLIGNSSEGRDYFIFSTMRDFVDEKLPEAPKESTIRLMTRLAWKHNAVNLSQGFPNDPPPIEPVSQMLKT